MEKVIQNLRAKSIIHRSQVIEIKKYIDNKYKTETTAFKANVFANAVHKIVDQSVNKFEKKHRLQIRSEVLKSAIAKDIFEVNGYDIFEVCSLLPIKENEKDDFFGILTTWVNDNQSVHVTVKEIFSLSTQFIDQAVKVVVDLLEESVLIEPEIKDYVKPKTRYDDDEPNILEDYITDGRFMDVPGETVELSIKDIEDALKQPIPTEETIMTDLKNNDIVNTINSHIEDKGNEDIHFDSESPSAEDEFFDSMDFIQELGDEEWEEVPIPPIKKAQITRLNGYELKPPTVEPIEKKMPTWLRLVIIVPAVLVAIMLIIVLIMGAIRISSTRAQIEELENRLAKQIELEEGILPKNLEDMELKVSQDIVEEIPLEGVNLNEGSHLASKLKYKQINEEQLLDYLTERNSLLADTYYIETFIQVAKDYNVNPLLLVAITGQEQNFVPKDTAFSKEKLNNPFNVLESWQIYNTNFEDACKIAARTILTSSQERPEDYDPIQWINKTYAEDSNWHKGVQYFFDELVSVASN